MSGSKKKRKRIKLPDPLGEPNDYIVVGPVVYKLFLEALKEIKDEQAKAGQAAHR